MAKVIIFGIRDLAELAHYYLSNDSNHEVVAFSVSKEYFPDYPVFKGLPIVEFEKIENNYLPSEYMFFAPITHKKMNRERERIYSEIKKKGYNLISYVSSRISKFNLDLGDNCFILEDNTIQPFVKIGSNVILWSGNHIGHHSIIENNVFITSHVVISGNCKIGPNCFIGINSSVKENITLGEASFVAMGTSITNNTEAFGVYSGNPAKKMNMTSNDLRF